MAHALHGLGLRPGDRVGTLAWNGHRHLELLYAVSGAGFVTHTINPRLFPEQIAGIVAHAEDRVLFVEPDLLGLVDALAERLQQVETIVVLCERAAMPASFGRPLLCYEELIATRARQLRLARPRRAHRRRASATPRARPERPRACSTRTAPACCMP